MCVCECIAACYVIVCVNGREEEKTIMEQVQTLVMIFKKASFDCVTCCRKNI